MKLATISVAALSNAAHHLRLVGDQAAADALLDLTDGHDALVIEGSEPLPRPLKIADLDQVGTLVKYLTAYRAQAERWAKVPTEGVYVEAVFYRRNPTDNRTTSVFEFDTEDTPNTGVETADIALVVSEHVAKRISVLESQLRALGVDPSL